MVTLDWSSRIRAGSSPSCKRQMTVLRFMRPTRSRPLRSSAFQRLIFNKPFQRYHKHDALFFPCHFNYKEFRLGPRPVTDMVSLHTPSNDGEMQNQNTIPGHRSDSEPHNQSCSRCSIAMSALPTAFAANSTLWCSAFSPYAASTVDVYDQAYPVNGLQLTLSRVWKHTATQ